jgi:hypothetical protein
MGRKLSVFQYVVEDGAVLRLVSTSTPLYDLAD